MTEELRTLAGTLFQQSAVQALLSHDSFLCPSCYRLPEQLIMLTNKANDLKNRILQSLLRAGGSLGFTADNEKRDHGFELSDSGPHTPARKRSGTDPCTEPSKKRALDFGICSSSDKSPPVHSGLKIGVM